MIYLNGSFECHELSEIHHTATHCDRAVRAGRRDVSSSWNLGDSMRCITNLTRWICDISWTWDPSHCNTLWLSGEGREKIEGSVLHGLTAVLSALTALAVAVCCSVMYLTESPRYHELSTSLPPALKRQLYSIQQKQNTFCQTELSGQGEDTCQVRDISPWNPCISRTQ